MQQTTQQQAAELVKSGRVTEALSALEQEVRRDASDPRQRIFLFQLLCVIGDWRRAAKQAEAASALDASYLPMARLTQDAIQCELLRADVFAGKRQPLVFGEPSDWVGWMVQALQLSATNKGAAAAELRAKALEAAPAVSGAINDQAFEWVGDADLRLGPIVEAYIEGKYFWVPLARVRSISIEPPTGLSDVVWCPAQFTWTNGGSAVGLIPSRYPGTESTQDGALRLARKTEWQDAGDGLQTGLGQRLWVTDFGDVPLLETRTLRLGEPDADADAAPEGEAAAAAPASAGE